VIDDGDFETFEIMPELIYAMRISEDEVQVFISDSQSLRFSQLALDLLGDAIDPFRT
jgi:hypothetical protein